MLINSRIFPRAAILGLLLLSAASLCWASGNERWWVLLKDKGIAADDLEKQVDVIEKSWNPRSLQRRHKCGVKLDAADLPVFEQYKADITRIAGGIDQESRWLNAVSVTCPEKTLDEVSRLPFVTGIRRVAAVESRTIELDPGSTTEPPLDMAFDRQRIPGGAYGASFLQARMIGALDAHERGFTGQGVLLGMLDTGFQLDHRAFSGLDVVAQYDFINNDGYAGYDPVTDRRGQANHGTACLSVITGYEPGYIVGIAPNVSVALAKTELTGVEIRREEDYWIAGIEWLEWLGADVVSSSLSYRKWYDREDFNGSTAPVTLAARRAAELGMVVCNSAGNEGPGIVTIGAPADAPGILAVAAVDSMREIVGFSSRGPSCDGRIKPDVAALGRGVVCVRPLTWKRYSKWNGTSLSCPLVAGVAALVIEAHPDWQAWQVVEAIRETADRAAFPDNTYGFGIVDACAAIDYPEIYGRVIDLENGCGVGDIRVTLQGREFNRVLLTTADGRYSFTNLPPGNYSLMLQNGSGWDNTFHDLAVPPSLPVDCLFRVK